MRVCVAVPVHGSDRWMKPALPMSGGCLCGQVRYEVRAEPLTLAMCHCTICQVRTGSAFSMAMAIPREGFVLVKGSTIVRELPGGSGALLTQHFCENCLVRTHTEPHAHPALTYVRPGTLDDPKWIKPQAQIWTRSAHAWACVEGVPAFEQAAGNPGALDKSAREPK